jgi:hypothetical protein
MVARASTSSTKTPVVEAETPRGRRSMEGGAAAVDASAKTELAAAIVAVLFFFVLPSPPVSLSPSSGDQQRNRRARSLRLGQKKKEKRSEGNGRERFVRERNGCRWQKFLFSTTKKWKGERESARERKEKKPSTPTRKSDSVLSLSLPLSSCLLFSSFANDKCTKSRAELSRAAVVKGEEEEEAKKGDKRREALIWTKEKKTRKKPRPLSSLPPSPLAKPTPLS